MIPAALIALAALIAAPTPAAPRQAPRPPASPVPGVRMDTGGPPPAPLADPRGEAPSADAVWIDGYWQWSADKWSWVRGEWTVPPCRPACTWVPARWTSDAHGQVFHEPYWNPPDGATRRVHEPTWVAHTTSSTAPPPLLVEVPEPAPARDSVWIPGFWSWTGSRYAWVAGNWSRPYPGRSWVEGHWKRSGPGFAWVPGRWRAR
jgi:hypothetical protein